MSYHDSHWVQTQGTRYAKIEEKYKNKDNYKNSTETELIQRKSKSDDGLTFEDETQDKLGIDMALEDEEIQWKSDT